MSSFDHPLDEEEEEGFRSLPKPAERAVRVFIGGCDVTDIINFFLDGDIVYDVVTLIKSRILHNIVCERNKVGVIYPGVMIIGNIYFRNFFISSKIPSQTYIAYCYTLYLTI